MPIGYGQSKDCFRREKAVAWAHILVGYEYNSKGNPTVRYAAGQPMVVYSSWCAMALTHHLIVRVAALRAGFPHFMSYALLRDDLLLPMQLLRSNTGLYYQVPICPSLK